MINSFIQSQKDLIWLKKPTLAGRLIPCHVLKVISKLTIRVLLRYHKTATETPAHFVWRRIPLCANYIHFSAWIWRITGQLHTFWAENARRGTWMRALNLVWSAVWWNEGLFMAGNPFEGRGAHLDLALFAHRPCGQVCILPWLVWPSTCRWAEAERHRTRVTMRHSPSHGHGAHLCCKRSLMGSVASALCFCR